MENDIQLEQITYSKKRKLLFELKDLFAGVAFPFIISIVFSSTVIMFASFDADLAVQLVALVGGEVLFTGALVIFGRANGAAAYRKTVSHERKRSLGSSDERVAYGTGEYKLWKGALIGFMITVPFILVQIIELIVPNVFCGFCLEYVFAWAYYPFSFLGKSYQALNFIMIILPVGVHTLGYFLGKLKEIKVQEELASQELERKSKRKKK